MIKTDRQRNTSVQKCLWCGAQTKLGVNCFDRRFGIKGRWDYYLCPDCNSYSIHPLPSQEQLQEWYQEFYAPGISCETRKQGFLHHYKHKLDGQENLEQLLQPGAVLDIGCGAGNFLAIAQNLGHEVWGQEFNSKMVKVAQNRGLKVTELTLNSNYFPHRYFANIVLSQLIEHVDKPQQLLRDILPLLAPEGQIIISTPNPHCTLAKLYQDAWAGWHPPFHLCLVSKQSLVQVAAEMELTCTRLQTNTPTWLFVLNWMSFRYGKEGTFNAHLLQGLTKLKHVLLMPIIPILRFIDWLGFGDNTVIVLRKNSLCS